MDSSASKPPEPGSAPASTAAPPVPQSRLPSHWQSILVLARSDLGAVAGSWLCRGFFLVSAFFSILMLKGMQAEQRVASEMLEALYATYLVLWMHAVIFVAGGALAREHDCLNDAILSRGITRAEYLAGKLLARSLAVFGMISLVLVPGSFWAIRQDQLVRTESGYVTSNAQSTLVEAYEPRKIFAGTDGNLLEMDLEVGDQVQAGDVLAQIDDRLLFDQLETERRAEENARNEVSNTQRRFQDAQRAVDQAEDSLSRAERALIGKDLLSKLEQADRETELRSRKRDLANAQNQLQISQDAIATTERQVEDTLARVREARQKLGRATLTAPVSGYVTEVLVASAQYVALGTHLFTIAPLDAFQVRVPVYQFEEFKRLREGLPATIKIEDTEYTGAIDRLGATTAEDRWGRRGNYVLVRFQGDGTLGLLGQNADVRLTLPPPETSSGRVATLYNALTGQGTDDLESRTSSVPSFWMLIGLGKVLGCAGLLVALTTLLLTSLRNQLIAVLATIGLWHVSNLIFDFAGLPDLSYLEMVRTMDRTLGGIANPSRELGVLAWLAGITVAIAALALGLFVSRDPPR